MIEKLKIRTRIYTLKKGYVHMFTRSYDSFRVFSTQKYQEHTSMPRCCLLVQ